jgi:hypothetical protein
MYLLKLFFWPGSPFLIIEKTDGTGQIIETVDNTNCRK